MSPEIKLVLAVVLVAGAMAAGYVARRLGLTERFAHKAMWFVVVFGYPSVGLLAVWRIELRPEHTWLPILAALFIVSLTFLSLGVGRLLTRERPLVGLFAISGGLGNTGFTMGAFLCYLFFGNDGLGLAAVHDLAWSFLIVFLMYPIARRCSDEQPLERAGLGTLIWRSLWDVRSMSLAATVAGMLLNASGAAYPTALIERTHFIELMMFTTVALAFFSIALRLHVAHVLASLKLIIGLGVVRFVIGPALGLALVWAMWQVAPLLPFPPISGVARGVFHVETCIPTAVTMVAIANLFHLRPREASALFVFNTLSYLVVCVPVLYWVSQRFWSDLRPVAMP